MARNKFTLSIQADLIRRIKYQAIDEGRDVSDIVEQLFREYLERHEAGQKRKQKR